MPVEIGQIEAIFRYPVKSMRGEPLDEATLGGFPWLTAGKLPELMLFTPRRREDGTGEALPTHVVTLEGEELPVFGDALAAEIERRCGAPVQMMQLNHGMFDNASLPGPRPRLTAQGRASFAGDDALPSLGRMLADQIAAAELPPEEAERRIAESYRTRLY